VDLRVENYYIKLFLSTKKIMNKEFRKLLNTKYMQTEFDLSKIPKKYRFTTKDIDKINKNKEESLTILSPFIEDGKKFRSYALTNRSKYFKNNFGSEPKKNPEHYIKIVPGLEKFIRAKIPKPKNELVKNKIKKIKIKKINKINKN
jgi:hypothetical protein